MEAFRGAVDIGAHAIETDVHLSRDKVVVLSHVRRRRPLWQAHSCLCRRPGN